MKKTFSSKKIIVLGADGLIGSALFASLKEKGFAVYGTTRRKVKDGKFIFLDTLDAKSVSSFNWKKFDIFIDCTGKVKYNNDIFSMKDVLKGNVIAPLNVLDKLSGSQRYFYCSTHAVLLPFEKSTAYARSKSSFEDMAALSSGFSGRVTILRLPAVFSRDRSSGLINRVKDSFTNKKKLDLDVETSCWHAMYLPRLAEIMGKVAVSGTNEHLITIGYPVETSVRKIISVAEKTFGYNIKVSFVRNKSDHYKPDVKLQSKYVAVRSSAFENDLRSYFAA